MEIQRIHRSFAYPGFWVVVGLWIIIAIVQILR